MFLILLQRPEGKNDKEKGRRKGDHSGGKREEQRGRKGAKGRGARGRETAVSFWEEKLKVTVMSQGAAAPGLLKTPSLDSAPKPAGTPHALHHLALLGTGSSSRVTQGNST